MWSAASQCNIQSLASISLPEQKTHQQELRIFSLIQKHIYKVYKVTGWGSVAHKQRKSS